MAGLVELFINSKVNVGQIFEVWALFRTKILRYPSFNANDISNFLCQRQYNISNNGIANEFVYYPPNANDSFSFRSVSKIPKNYLSRRASISN